MRESITSVFFIFYAFVINTVWRFYAIKSDRVN